MIALEITFKSGAQILVEVESWEMEKSSIAKSLSWRDAPDAKRTLVTFDMAEVAAIVEVQS
jgi:hypothetical protein